MELQYIKVIKQFLLKFQISQQISKTKRTSVKQQDRIKVNPLLEISTVMKYRSNSTKIYDDKQQFCKLLYFYFQKTVDSFQIFLPKLELLFIIEQKIEEMNQTSESYFSVADRNALQEITNSQKIRRGKRSSSKTQHAYNLIEQEKPSHSIKNDQITDPDRSSFEDNDITKQNKGTQKKVPNHLIITNNSIERQRKDSIQESNIRLNIDLSKPNEISRKFQFNEEDPAKQQNQQSRPAYLNANQKIQIKVEQQTRPVSQKTQQRPKTSNKQRQMIQIQSFSDKGKNRQMVIGMAQIEQNIFGSVKQVSINIKGQHIFLVRKSCMLLQTPNFYMYRNVNMGNDEIGYLQGNVSGSLYNFYYSNQKVELTNSHLMMTIYFLSESLLSINNPKRFEIFIRKSDTQIPNEKNKNLKQLYEQDTENILRIKKFKTKEPTWHPQKGCYSMNFKGLCNQASVQNFILIQEKSQKQVMFFCKNNEMYTYKVSENIQDTMIAAIVASTLDFKWISE